MKRAVKILLFSLLASLLSPLLFLSLPSLLFSVDSTGTISATKTGTGLGIKKKSSREGKPSFGYRVASLFG